MEPVTNLGSFSARMISSMHGKVNSEDKKLDGIQLYCYNDQGLFPKDDY